MKTTDKCDRCEQEVRIAKLQESVCEECLYKEEIEPNGPISSVVELTDLFRVRGHQGIFYPVSQPNKSGMVGMKKWHAIQSVTAKKSDVISIGSMVFHREGSRPLPIHKVMDNLFDEYGEKQILIHVENEQNLMETSCPNYDHDQFKPYHLKQLIKWYNEILYNAFGVKEAA